ncbi:hypothetical protein [Amycolatopsis echigonensis]|uniref:hypothetical protein n=1 Tax=Amycolatopsis echigonensis TaxID=2576905 RepID=UPI00142D6826|nr:hypothetical protein [Amycolatopsis niigatensis]
MPGPVELYTPAAHRHPLTAQEIRYLTAAAGGRRAVGADDPPVTGMTSATDDAIARNPSSTR